jgi:hypothetical protein
MLFFILCTFGAIILGVISYQNQDGLAIAATIFATLCSAMAAAHHERISRHNMSLFKLSIKH